MEKRDVLNRPPSITASFLNQDARNAVDVIVAHVNRAIPKPMQSNAAFVMT